MSLRLALATVAAFTFFAIEARADGPFGTGRLKRGDRNYTTEERDAALRRFEEHRTWSGPNALTVPRGRYELAVFGGARYGVTDQIELAVNPLVVVMLPHLEGKLMLRRAPESALGVRARLSYPTTFLEVVSKEGSFGLLPKNSRPPVAIQLELDALGTTEWTTDQLLSLWLGVAVAPHGAFDPLELPLLDFPFLYPRFAPLHAPAVPRVGMSFEGRIAAGLWYSLEFLTFLMPGLPDVERAFAFEQSTSLEYRFSDRFALSLGLRTSHARYPVGVRTHFLPFLDARFQL